MKIRSPKHLAFVRSDPCCIKKDGEHCSGEPVVAHHLTFLGGQGMGTKECDSRTVPLCATHHLALHSIGEKRFWALWEIDAEEVASAYAAFSVCEKISNSILKDY